MSNDRVNAIHEAADGTVWIGTQNGLDHWDASARPVERYTEADGLSGNTVSCILEDDTRALWISTNRGISRLDTTTGSADVLWHGGRAAWSQHDGLGWVFEGGARR